MALKGLVNLHDYVLPLGRNQFLTSLLEVKKNESNLTTTEKKELVFFLKDFFYDDLIKSSISKISFLKADTAGRFRSFYNIGSSVQIFADPVIGANYSKYTSKHNLNFYSGARIWGMLGKNIAFNIMFRDVTEKGDSINYKKDFTPVTGIVNTSRNNEELNYSYLNFNLGYQWNNGSISIGKDHINWGYGMAGKIVISEKAPSFPYLRLDYHPFKWLHFNYFNGWLNSNLIDSSRSYNTGTGVGGSYREVYRKKFLANHSININAFKGLDIAIGESMVYSDQLDIGYLIPINFFKVYDQYASNYKVNGGSNAQFFGQISSRNHIKKTHLYLVYFIDELRVSKIFDKIERRNQLGYTLGLNKTDFLLNYLTLGVEYTHINPFVYSNLIPAQSYENSDYSMGDWMGNNADRWYFSIKYTPIAKLKINLWYQQVRKGETGTLQQQYFQQPQPDFLFGKLFTINDLGINVSYEWINRFIFFINSKYQKKRYSNIEQISTDKELRFGFFYGL